VSYSRARLQNGSDHLGAVDRADMNIQQVGWTADRPSVDSTEWTIIQTAGRDWYNLNNYTLSNVVTGRTRTKTQQFNEQINFRHVLPWSQPTFFKTGLYHQVLTRAGDRKAQATYGWVGPNGSAAASPAPVSIADFRIGQAFGGNVQSLPVPDKTELYRLIFTQPGYFTQTEAQRATDLDAILGGNQSIQEAVTAAYLMGNTRVGRLHLQAGLRYEGTETESRSSRRISDANNPYPANTVARILHRWSGGRDFRTGSYEDYLPSAAATYRFSPAMQVKLGYHKAVRRPDLSQLAATWDIDDANQEIDLPNPNLKPERSEKYSVLLEYYFEPAGTAGVHFFQSTLTNNAQRTDYLPASEFGYENDPLYSGYLFRGWETAPTTRRFRGVEFNYTQQLAFFRNEFLRGMRVFAAYSMYNARPRPNNYVSRNGSAGVSFRYRGFSGKFNGTWRPDVWTGGNTVPTANNTYFFPGDREAQKERVIIDIDGAYQMTRRLAVFASVRNAFNAPIQWYYPESDRRIRQQEKFGAQWTVGVRGSF
jgi:iron complex outermembrane receptor protein